MSEEIKSAKIETVVSWMKERGPLTPEEETRVREVAAKIAEGFQLKYETEFRIGVQYPELIQWFSNESFQRHLQEVMRNTTPRPLTATAYEQRSVR